MVPVVDIRWGLGGDPWPTGEDNAAKLRMLLAEGGFGSMLVVEVIGPRA